MKFKIIWSDFADSQLENIFAYYTDKANVKVATKIIQHLILTPDKLIENPYIGKVEEFLLERKESF